MNPLLRPAAQVLTLGAGQAAAAAGSARRLIAPAPEQRPELDELAAALPQLRDALERVATSTAALPAIQREVAKAVKAGSGSDRLAKRVKSIERSTSELPAVRKRVEELSRAANVMAELAESLPRLERAVGKLDKRVGELATAIDRGTPVPPAAERRPPL